MRATRMAIARTLSIVGHPLVVITSAVAAVVLHTDASSAVSVTLLLCGIAGIVLAFSLWQVRRGRWQHVDASAPAERTSLNLLIAGLLLSIAAVVFHRSPRSGLALGMGLSGLLIVVVISLSPWAKLSLHASFSAFAAMLLWAFGPWPVALASLAVTGICWSRVVLGRHTSIEVVAGGVVGALLGACFWLIRAASS
jgi:hypothetical protein